MAKKVNAKHEDVLKEARTRFDRCATWEKTARLRFLDDLRFCEGDSDNLYQWPEEIRGRMEDNRRAMLTINQTQQHCLQVLNDARQNRVGIKVRATGGGASAESADVFAQVVKHIEYASNASAAYQTALEFAVRGGVGYWRVLTDYANDESFDQEVFIRRVKDPLSIYLDPDINEEDGSDARYGFVFSDLPTEEFDRKFPAFKGSAKNVQLGDSSWVRDKVVRVAEYFRRVDVKDRLLAWIDPESGEQKVERASELPPEVVKGLEKDPQTKSRPITSAKVEWFKLVGDQVAEERDWLGSFIPIVRVIGRETVIDGEMDRKGHTRALKDPNRMFNYNASGAVEYGALQSKTPWVAAADAIESYEEYWDTANTENHSVLPYNHVDDEGQTIPPPSRQEPPRAAPVFMQGMQDAAEWMRMVSGQYQSEMGAPGNERSGAAITQRQRQGDNATFHFLDNQSSAIRLTGKILIELIPKVYDTERVLTLMSEDGTETTIKIDPNAQTALQKVAEDRAEVQAIFNPAVGRYEVLSDVGAAMNTLRQEGWNAYVQILSQNKDLVHLIGDLAFKCADFPGAEEIAERLKRMVPAQALQDGPPPELAAAQQQITALQGMLAKVAEKLADKTAVHLHNQEKAAIGAYDAQTRRLGAIKEALATQPELLMRLVQEVLDEAIATSETALMPALEPTRELTAQDVAGPVPPQMAPAMSKLPGWDGVQGPLGAPPANGNPDDMTTGPAQAQPGVGPQGA